MPEDLPKAVLVLLWLLIGLIVLGYLIMAQPILYSVLFAVLYYGIPISFYFYQKQMKNG